MVWKTFPDYMNKVYTKEKTVKVAEFERVFKIHVA